MQPSVNSNRNSIPVAMTIAGSDNSAGAGAQADLKTMSALGVYGVTAITCVVAEIPGKVSAIQPVNATVVAEQIRLLFEAFPVAALKTGMLFSGEIIETVCATLAPFLRGSAAPPLVVDPVMVATSGDPLLQRDAITLYRERLFPMASLITPNLDEVRTLLGEAVSNLEEMRTAGLELAGTFNRAFLIKGGHLRLDPAVDLLCLPDGAVHSYSAPFIPGVSTHGTGCTYAAAITAGLAGGLALPDAVGAAKEYLARAVAAFLRWPRAHGETDALHHFAPTA